MLPVLLVKNEILDHTNIKITFVVFPSVFPPVSGVFATF